MQKLLKSSWKQFINNPKLVVFSTISDFIFVMSVFYVVYTAWFNIAEAATKIQDLLGGQITAGVGIEALQQLVAQQDVFWQNYQIILYNVLVFVVAFYVLWTVFQGFSWLYAYKITKQKIKPLLFYKRFAVISLLMVVAMAACFYLATQLSVFLSKSIIPIVESGTTQKFIPVLLAVVLYFTVAAFTIIKEKFTWKQYKIVSLKNWKKNIPAFLLALVAFLVLNYMLMQIYARVPMPFFALITVCVVLPLYTFLRICILNSFKQN